jgi:paraquat-inducible protein B
MEPTTSQATPTPSVAEPAMRRRSGPSVVWLIPLITALIGGWLIYKTISEQGPVITVSFKTAEGIEPGTTRVKYKNVDMGVVESLRFTNDYSQVILTLQMEKNAAHLLRRGTRFWVVRPRLSLREVSGLGTLISGAYIALDPGEGTMQKHFKGLDTPPVLTTEDDGKKVLLMAPRLGSLGIGSPIYYQGILAGEVLGYELGDDLNSVLIHAFINAPYDDLVKGNSRFWNVSGLDVSIDADGIKVRTESLESLMFGGIAFETPATLEPVSGDVSGLVFTLHPSYKSIEENAYTQKVPFVLFFDGSVRGLNIGAPVEFKGIKVGSVRDIRLEFHAEDTSFRIPVLIELEPERIIRRGEGGMASPRKTLDTLIERGLRARLKTGNILTGQLFVELVMRPDSEVHLADVSMDLPQLPTIPADLEEFTSSIKAFLTKLDRLDLEGIAAELHGTLTGSNKLLNSGKLEGVISELEGTLAGSNRLLNHAKLDSAVTDLAASLASLKGILATLDKRAGPLSENTIKALGSLSRSLDKAHETMTLMDGVLKPDSLLHYRVIQMSDEMAETARSIRAFVNMLERNPEAMIFGKQPPRE